jgi:hypothetical protein
VGAGGQREGLRLALRAGKRAARARGVTCSQHADQTNGSQSYVRVPTARDKAHVSTQVVVFQYSKAHVHAQVLSAHLERARLAGVENGGED